MLDFITEKTDCWDYLKSADLPVFIYGMGDGALKIMSVFERYGIPLAGFFASDEFVRGHTFQGHLVHTLSQIEALIDDFVIVLAFAAGHQSLYDRINEIAKRHILLAPDVPVAGETLLVPLDEAVPESVTVLKLDVEGGEREAIMGARRHIENGAKILCSLYHRSEDMFDLPLLIKSINPELKFYIRHQLYIPAWETNLYAVRE